MIDIIKKDTNYFINTSKKNSKIIYYIKSACNIYFKFFYGFIGITALLFLMLALLFLIIQIPSDFSIIFSDSDPFLKSYIEYLNIIPVYSLFSFLFTTGYFVVAKKIYLNQTYSFRDFFNGLKHWKELLFASLIINLLLFVFYNLPLRDITFFYLKNYVWDKVPFQNTINPLLFYNWIIAAIFIIFGIYLIIAFKWTQFYIVFSEKNFVKSMTSSMKEISKRWYIFAAFYLILNVIVFVPAYVITKIIMFITVHLISLEQMVNILHIKGIIILSFIIDMIWIFFSIPILYISLYVSFEDIIGTSKRKININENSAEAEKLVLLE